MKRILVTGGAGFIGCNLIRQLVRAGHCVLNVDSLTYAGNLSSLNDVASQPNYAFAQVSITDFASVHREIQAFRPHTVFHLAAESHVDRSIDGPRQFVSTNIEGTFNLLQASLEYWRLCSHSDQQQFRFVHVSTDEVYGSLGSTGKFTETSPYDPHSPYSASKAAADHLALAWHSTYGLPVVVTHCSNNYGPYQFPEKLIPVVILKCLRSEPIPVYGNGQNVRDWLYVADHCEALEIVGNLGQPGQTYNIGGNNEMANLDLVHLLCDIVDQQQPRNDGRPSSALITFVTDRPGHDQRYAIDASKIHRELGWSPKQDRSTGMRDTVRWYLQNQSWWQDILTGKYRLGRQGLGASTG
ncbi:MAG: dTDP-glucose 4,6-dehydratase [Pirellulaceae bacterium]|nr:dTDP-glucose 4,6-dehydratase [Pirellulaceae bacterium]